MFYAEKAVKTSCVKSKRVKDNMRIVSIVKHKMGTEVIFAYTYTDLSM